MIGLKLNPDTTFVCSDYHFNHFNLCKGISNWKDKSGCRNFQNLNDMNEAIIDSHNSVVTKEHDVIFCGDLLFGDKSKWQYFLNRLNYRNFYWIRGNHDDWSRKIDFGNYVRWIGEYLEIFSLKTRFVFFHYPIYTWNDEGQGTIMCYGHQHTYNSNHLGRCLNLSWEQFKRPLSLSEIFDKVKDKTIICKDYHTFS